MQYRPLFDRVIVRPLSKDKTIGGITIQDKSHIRQAEVTAVGDKVDAVSVGDNIIYEDFAGIPLEQDKNLVILKQIDILAKGVDTCK